MHLDPPKTSHLALARVIDAYWRQGYEVVLGSPDTFVATLQNQGRSVDVSGGITLSDIQVFEWFADMAPWSSALVIGNSFGFSACLIAALCPGCAVDAIDAETEGANNREGSALTRALAITDFPGIKLTIGFSPKDLPAACRFERYDFILIDGLHTNEQLLADFDGIRERIQDPGIVYCHNVGIARMHGGWKQLCATRLDAHDLPYELHFTSVGSTCIVRGHDEVQSFLCSISKPLESVMYHLGAEHAGLRTSARMLGRTFWRSTRIGKALAALFSGAR